MTRQEIYVMPLQKVIKILQTKHPDMKNLHQTKQGSPNVTWFTGALPKGISGSEWGIADARDLLIELEKAR